MKGKKGGMAGLQDKVPAMFLFIKEKGKESGRKKSVAGRPEEARAFVHILHP